MPQIMPSTFPPQEGFTSAGPSGLGTSRDLGSNIDSWWCRYMLPRLEL